MRRGRVQCVLSRASAALLTDGGPVVAVRKVGGCQEKVSGALCGAGLDSRRRGGQAGSLGDLGSC